MRLLPSSAEAEKSIVSCMLMQPRECIALAEEAGVTVEWFVQPRFALVFETLKQMSAEDVAIDLITLTQRLRDAGTLPGAGGPGEVSELQHYLPTTANLTEYIEIAREKAWRRAAIKSGGKIAQSAYDDSGDLETQKQDVQRELTQLTISGQRDIQRPIRSHVMESITAAEFAQSADGIRGLSTGLEDLDEATGGLVAPDFTILAGPSGKGKTSLMMTTFRAIAVDSGLAVGIFSLEMTGKELCDVLIAQIAPVNLYSYTRGELAQPDLQRMAQAATAVSNAPIYIDDKPGRTAAEICGIARLWKMRHGIQVLGIDNAQLLGNPPAKDKKRHEHLEDASRMFKNLAKELSIPVILVSQLTGEDLRGSKSFGHDANNVMMIRHTDDESFIDITKQRSGPACSVPVFFDKPRVRFLDERFRPAKPVKEVTGKKKKSVRQAEMPM